MTGEGKAARVAAWENKHGVDGGPAEANAFGSAGLQAEKRERCATAAESRAAAGVSNSRVGKISLLEARVAAALAKICMGKEAE